MCDAGTRVLEAIDSFGETAIKIFKADEKYGEDMLDRFYFGKEIVARWSADEDVRNAAKEALKKLGYEV